jgi:multidrug resistance efflux pump
VAGIAWWLYSRTYESTDDAQINGHLNAIASRVAGTVKAVYVENDQPVKAGQTLVDLDPSDYEVLVAQARAGYEQAVAQSAAEDPNVPITVTSNRATVDTDVEQVINAEAAIASAQRDYDSNVAKLRQAEANNRKAQSDLVRYKKLVDQGEISLSDYDQYVASAGGDEAAVEASRYAAASSEQIVEEKKDESAPAADQTFGGQGKFAPSGHDSQGNRRVPQSQRGLGESATGYGSAQPELLPHRGPGRRDREPAQCGNRRQSFARAATHRGGSD